MRGRAWSTSTTLLWRSGRRAKPTMGDRVTVGGIAESSGSSIPHVILATALEPQWASMFSIATEVAMRVTSVRWRLAPSGRAAPRHRCARPDTRTRRGRARRCAQSPSPVRSRRTSRRSWRPPAGAARARSAGGSGSAPTLKGGTTQRHAAPNIDPDRSRKAARVSDNTAGEVQAVVDDHVVSARRHAVCEFVMDLQAAAWLRLAEVV